MTMAENVDPLLLLATLERPPLTPLQPEKRNEDYSIADDDDIYRGEPPLQSDTASLKSTASSGSSSSSSERQGGRLGAVAAVVELAISRWAKGVRRGRRSSSASATSSSSSSSSSSTSSSRSSINTLARARRRLRRRSSQTSIQTVHSERDILARITRLKALEESRQISRQFALYLPSTVEVPGRSLGVVLEGNSDDRSSRVVSTTSLSLVLSHLDIVTRKARGRRPRGRSRGPQNLLERSRTAARLPHQFNSDSVTATAHTVPSFDTPKKPKKGKHRESPASAAGSRNNLSPSAPLMPKAWFLDVASPTWEDLRAIGKVLHIHPLTLEDILQQDPREKLELFPKLGYYFISFRAIESEAERSKIQREARRKADAMGNDSEYLDVPIGEANVYLTVFNEGICCFHHRDISEHIDRVRNRIVLLDEVVNMSSDWIAHGLLDSIVDSFFPFLNEIEKEVMAIDHLVYAGVESDADLIQEDKIGEPRIPPLKAELDSELASPKHKEKISHLDEKSVSQDPRSSQESVRPHFAPAHPTVRMLIRRSRRYLIQLWERSWSRKVDTRISPRSTTLRRMAKTRRLVTSLGRLLATKSDLVTQVRKRLLQKSGAPSLGNGGSKGEELEVAIYMGDVQDHILTLQHSLNHIERMLSQSHPSYLSQLRNTLASSKGSTDKPLLFLTIVIIAVLCCQPAIGLFSMNVTIPSNVHEAGHPTNYFFMVIALACATIASYLWLVYYWWKTAKRKRGAMLRKDHYYVQNFEVRGPK